MEQIAPAELKVGHHMVFYSLPHEHNYVWKRPSDNEHISGTVTKIEDGVIHISRRDAYRGLDGAISGHSWTNLEVTVDEAQKYVDEGLIVVYAEFPIRTWD